MSLLQRSIKATVARGPVPREPECLSYSGIETGVSLLPRGIGATVARGPVPRERECLSYVGIETFSLCRLRSPDRNQMSLLSEAFP